MTISVLPIGTQVKLGPLDDQMEGQVCAVRLQGDPPIVSYDVLFISSEGIQVAENVPGWAVTAEDDLHPTRIGFVSPERD